MCGHFAKSNKILTKAMNILYVQTCSIGSYEQVINIIRELVSHNSHIISLVAFCDRSKSETVSDWVGSWHCVSTRCSSNNYTCLHIDHYPCSLVNFSIVTDGNLEDLEDI